jgi:hypothetical protein
MDRTIGLPGSITSILLLLLVLCSSPVSAVQIEVELPLDQIWNGAGNVSRGLGEVLANPTADRELLPRLSWWWINSPGEKIVSVELIDLQEELAGDLRRLPNRIPLLGGAGSPTRLTGGEPLFDITYSLRLSAGRTWHGLQMQSLSLTPLRVSERELMVLRRARVKLVIEVDELQGEICRPLREDFPLRDRVLAGLGEMILNPTALPVNLGRAVGGDGFPTEVPSLEGAAVDMVILTVDGYADICEEYAQRKTNEGVATVVRTVEWIQTRYPFGSDRAEMIRGFLQDAYAKWSLRYVMIVGDSDSIPPRYAYSEIFVEPRTSPTDMYYACLDGNWNADRDAHWSEAADIFQGEPGDGSDLMPELAVGRLPASDLAECEVMLGKLANYADCLGAPYQNRALLLGEVLFPSSWESGLEIFYDGADYCESVYQNYLGEDHEVVRLYENQDSFPEVPPLTRSATIDSMNSGFGFVLHNGHGARQTMSVGNGSLGLPAVRSLHNGHRTFMLYMVNCTAAAFDYNCIAETFLSNPDGGATAVIGSTRETFATYSSQYMNAFFEQLWTNPNLRLGDAFVAGLNAFVDETEEETGFRWAHHTFTLLGDPSAWHHYLHTDTLLVDHPESISLQGDPLTVTVTRPGGEPAQWAAVTVRKGEEDYQRGITDAAGQVSFILQAEHTGIYELRISCRDAMPYLATILAEHPVADPLLSIASFQVDDTVVGNGDAVADAGETIRLGLIMDNQGIFDAGNVMVTLRSDYPGLALLDSTDTFGDIPVGEHRAGLDSLVVLLGSVPDDAIIPFTLEIVCTEGTYAEEFFIEATAPLLHLYRGEVDDSAGGDGDGLLEQGETADLTFYFGNQGRGAAADVTALLTAPAGSGLTVLEPLALLGDLPPLQVDLGPALFTVFWDNPEPPLLELCLIDGHEYSTCFDFELTTPLQPPLPPSFEFGQTPSIITLNWEPDSGTVAYQVLRAMDPGGPYDPVSVHWIPNSTFEDSGLEPFSNYWYRLRGISAAGVLGALSDSSKVTTSLKLKEGWPVQLGQETPSTPVIVDVTGDGINELIIGADLLYGFDLAGNELANGDGDSLTYGPVSPLGQRFYCSLAATDLTDSPGLEVLAGSWDTGEVYLFEFNLHDGYLFADPAPGWPQWIGYSGGYGIWGSPSMADVDGDTDLEIFVADVGGFLMGWHHDGSEIIDGDGIPMSEGIFATGVGTWPRATVAFADVDDDGDMELFLCTTLGSVVGLDGDGTPLPGFPFQVNWENPDHRGNFGSPAIGDIDGDDKPEIVFASDNDSLYCINHDGTLREGWPVYFKNNNNYLMSPAPVLADLNGDTFPEIFACSVHSDVHMELAWFDSTGVMLPGWPVIAESHSQASPAVADLDGDWDLEVVVCMEDGRIWAWHHDGLPVDGFPLITGDFVRSSPVITDVDKDGFLDLVVAGWDMNVYFWEFPTVFDPDGTPWYTFMHDQKRSGNHDALDWVIGLPDQQAPGTPAVIRLDPNWPNPFNPVTTIQFTIAGDGGQKVRLTVHDVQGRLVRELVSDQLEPGVYRHDWAGRDDNGVTVGSSVYFARLQVGEVVETRKMTLVK